MTTISLPELNGRLVEIERQRNDALTQVAIFAGRLTMAALEIKRLEEELAKATDKAAKKAARAAVKEGVNADQ